MYTLLVVEAYRLDSLVVSHSVVNDKRISCFIYMAV